MASHWRTVRIFISSTFRDMHAERDWLREHVIPELEERLRRRRCHLEAIDLRWGVQTVSVDEEQSKEFLVLKVCLDEINRSRPFLVALLGDRYGWVPPTQRMQAAVDEAGFRTDVAAKSITALEIEFGVLDCADQRRRSHFYFRAPLPYDQMLPALAAQYSDAHAAGPASRAAWDRLQGLKARIERDLPGRVHRYSAAWDAARQEVGGLEAFGRQVLEDFWRDLQEEVPESAAQAPRWQDEERAAFDDFVEHTTRDFVGREGIAARLLGLARSPTAEGQPWGACVTGPSGSGKSALLAQVYRAILKERDTGGAGRLVLAHWTGVTPRSQSVDSLLVRWVEEMAAFLGEEPPATRNVPAEELNAAFASLLGRAAQRTRVVVLLDALNQFEPTVRARHLTWLPVLWPANARLIAAAMPCTASGVLEQRPGVTALTIEALALLDAQEIIGRICARYHRTPHPDVVAALTGKRRTDGSSAAGNPLWLTLATEELNLLGEDDFRRTDHEFVGAPDQRLHQLLLAVAAEMPADVEGLYGWMLGRTEQMWGEAWTRAFADLTALSRNGWREADLGKLMPAVSGEAWDAARFAGLRRSFRGHLVERGALGQWDFTHTQARLAIAGRNLGDPARVRRLHLAIADHLESLPAADPLRESETMFHLIGADDRLRAARYYGGELTDGEAGGATRALAACIAQGEAQDPNPGVEWAASLLGQQGTEKSLVGALCHRFNFDLYVALHGLGKEATKFPLLRATEGALSDLLREEPDNATWLRDLAIIQDRTGDVVRAMGNTRDALAAYRSCKSITARLAVQEPENIRYQSDLAQVQNDLGELLLAQGDTDGAMKEYRDALAIRERLASQPPYYAKCQEDLAGTQTGLGDVYRARGDAAEAIRAYKASLQWMERLAELYPEHTNYRRAISVRYERIAEVLRAEHDIRGALRAYGVSLDIRKSVAAREPENDDRQRDLTAAYLKVGDMLLALGDSHEALKAFGESLAIAKRLADKDPSDTDRHRNVAFGHERMGDIAQAAGDPTEALRAYQASFDIFRRLAEQDHNNGDWQRDLAIAHDKIGETLLAQGDPNGALRVFRAGLGIREALALENPDSAEWQRDLAVGRNKVGDALRSQGDFEGAFRSYCGSLEIRETLARRYGGSVQFQHDVVTCLWRLGKLRDQTGPLAEAQVYWKRCHDLLRGMKARGMLLDDNDIALLGRLDREFEDKEH